MIIKSECELWWIIQNNYVIVKLRLCYTYELCSSRTMYYPNVQQDLLYVQLMIYAETAIKRNYVACNGWQFIALCWKIKGFPKFSRFLFMIIGLGWEYVNKLNKKISSLEIIGAKSSIQNEVLKIQTLSLIWQFIATPMIILFLKVCVRIYCKKGWVKLVAGEIFKPALHASVLLWTRSAL